MEYGNITTDDDVDIDDTWRCPNPDCNLPNHPDGPPQCTCGTMRPGYDCCMACEDYAYIAMFAYDNKRKPFCPPCYQLYRRNTGAPLYLGALALLAVVIVLVLIMGLVGAVE